MCGSLPRHQVVLPAGLLGDRAGDPEQRPQPATAGSAAAAMPASDRTRSPGPVRAAPSRPGRPGCGRAARSPCRRPTARSLERPIARGPGSRPRARAGRGHLDRTDGARRRSRALVRVAAVAAAWSAEDGCSPWSTTTAAIGSRRRRPTCSDGEGQRQGVGTARAGHQQAAVRRRSATPRRPGPGSASPVPARVVPSGADALLSRWDRSVRRSAPRRRRARRSTSGAWCASPSEPARADGSAISALVGSVSGEVHTRLSPSIPTAAMTALQKAAPSRYCRILASSPSSLRMILSKP